jgi:hypothetical protein
MAANDQLAKERTNAVEALHQQHIAFKEKCEEAERYAAKIKELEAENAEIRSENLNFADM